MDNLKERKKTCPKCGGDLNNDNGCENFDCDYPLLENTLENLQSIFYQRKEQVELRPSIVGYIKSIGDDAATQEFFRMGYFSLSSLWL
jgi:hypothetical protein